MQKKLLVQYSGTTGPYLCPRKQKKEKVMLGNLITLALAALAVWFLVDSAIEFVRDGQDDNLVTEP